MGSSSSGASRVTAAPRAQNFDSLSDSQQRQLIDSRAPEIGINQRWLNSDSEISIDGRNASFRETSFYGPTVVEVRTNSGETGILKSDGTLASNPNASGVVRIGARMSSTTRRNIGISIVTADLRLG